MAARAGQPACCARRRVGVKFPVVISSLCRAVHLAMAVGTVLELVRTGKTPSCCWLSLGTCGCVFAGDHNRV